MIKSIGNICSRDDAYRVQPHEKLSLDPIARAEFLGAIRAHVPAADDCGPFADLRQFVSEDNGSFHGDEGIRRSIVLHAERCVKRAGEVPALYGVSAGVEQNVPVFVSGEPHGRDVRPPIGPRGSEGSGAGRSRKEVPQFVIGHGVIAHEPVLAGQEAEAHVAARVVDVEINEDECLPGAQSRVPTDDRNGDGRADQDR